MDTQTLANLYFTYQQQYFYYVQALHANQSNFYQNYSLEFKN